MAENDKIIKQDNFNVYENKFPLENYRLILRKWTNKDVDDLYEFMKQSEVMNAVGAQPLEYIEEARNRLRIIQNCYDTMYKYELAIFCKKDRKAIGTIVIKLKNISYNIVEIGYLLNKNYWNQGIMTESMLMVIDYIRSISKSVKIVCECNVNNLASKKVIEKCQMTFREFVQRDKDTFAVYEL